mmetsp:Transcript_23931/g.57726  ORF Transcript_23931/g.57726 Transcript_23931/m.57726 type:complete len:109 (+) Transcript_23931:121-447(+)
MQIMHCGLSVQILILDKKKSTRPTLLSTDPIVHVLLTHNAPTSCYEKDHSDTHLPVLPSCKTTYNPGVIHYQAKNMHHHPNVTRLPRSHQRRHLPLSIMLTLALKIAE